VSDLVFVGGTGRSGTHVIARLLGQHSHYEMIPIECRFHCNPSGLADVVTGKATPEEFVAKLRKFWWHRVRHGGRALARVASLARRGGKVRGLHKIIARERFEQAVAGFEESCHRDPVSASRALFFDLLAPLAADAGKPGLVEMSCFTIASAPGLARIFPEARFVHAVRDGRDSASSKVAKRQKEHHPTGVTDGIDWWLGRLRLAEEGVRGLDDPGRVVPISLDELVWGDRERAYGDLCGFLELSDEPAMREFFSSQMSADAAHRERWREEISEPDQEVISRRYEAALAQLAADDYQCAAVLRRSYEQGAARV
jgi:sulfotransferase family protein